MEIAFETKDDYLLRVGDSFFAHLYRHKAYHGERITTADATQLIEKYGLIKIADGAACYKYRSLEGAEKHLNMLRHTMRSYVREISDIRHALENREIHSL